MARMGVLIALLAVSAQVSVVIGPVPFTLQTLVVTLVALVLPPAQAAATLGGYVLLGALGLPVFSLMRGGLAMIAGAHRRLLGSTALFSRHCSARSCAGRSAGRGGCRQHAGVRGRASSRATSRAWWWCSSCATPWGPCTSCSWARFPSTPPALVSSLALTVLPFILPDVLKGAAAILVSAALHRAIPTLGALGRLAHCGPYAARIERFRACLRLAFKLVLSVVDAEVMTTAPLR